MRSSRIVDRLAHWRLLSAAVSARNGHKLASIRQRLLRVEQAERFADILCGARRVAFKGSIVLMIAATLAAQPQPARKVAVYNFEDIVSSQPYQIGRKLSDRLLSKLAGSGVYQMIDRQFLEKVLREQQLPADRFDPSTAVTVGKLVNVAAIVSGHITTFTFNNRSSEDSVGYYGTVTVAVTALLISAETGTILLAPAASQAAKGLVDRKPTPPQQANCRVYPIVGLRCTPKPASNTPAVETKTMDQLIDEATEACAVALSADIVAARGSVTVSSTTASDPRPTLPANSILVAGVVEGVTYIDKGSNSGLRVGQVLQVYRVSVVPGVNDPTSGKPLTRKVKVCTLTLSDVDESSSSGKCTGNDPERMDIVNIGTSAPGPGGPPRPN